MTAPINGIRSGLRLCTLESDQHLESKTEKKEIVVSHLSAYLNPLQCGKLNLSNIEILKLYLGKEFQSERYVEVAGDIAKMIYEVKPRLICGSNCGMAFLMDPEILAYAMEKSKGETVLEMGGAAGENGTLLAFSGAKQVFMNDLDSSEMGHFSALREQLPPQVKKKLEPIEGNCLDILKKKPELKGQIGLVLCRNLIHFMNDEKQTEFFQQLKELLKPGGTAILSVNAKYSFLPDRKAFEANPSFHSFLQTQCLVTDLDVSSAPKSIIFRELLPCSKDLISNEFISNRIYSRYKGQKWTVDNEAFKQIDRRLQPRIKESIEQNKAEIGNIKNGTVRVLTTHIQIYSKENLIKLCQDHGFEVEFSYAIGPDGHLVHAEELYGKARFCGVILKKPA